MTYDNRMDTKQTASRPSILLKLFLVSLRISAFTFGGGFVIVGFMKQFFVDRLHWLTEEEMLDYTALAQTIPGPIAVNAAVLVGRHVAGVWGMAAAVLGTVIPPIVILSVISLFYGAFASNPYVSLFLLGMRAGVSAVIMDVVCTLGIRVLKEKSWIHTLLMALSFAAAFFFKVPVILIILIGILIGIVLAALESRRPA